MMNEKKENEKSKIWEVFNNAFVAMNNNAYITVAVCCREVIDKIIDLIAKNKNRTVPYICMGTKEKIRYVYNQSFIDESTFRSLKFIADTGNIAAHDSTHLKENDAKSCYLKTKDILLKYLQM